MDLIDTIRTEFEDYFENSVLENCPEEIDGLKEMVSYHFGWDGSAKIASKRLRPMFLLLTYATLTGSYREAFSAATALEVLHNYTLIHDDIEDQGEERHGHPALWKVYGIPLAINVGDYLSSLSHYLMGTLPPEFSVKIQQKVSEIFQKSSLEVIQGQQLDISYESLDSISVAGYLGMIRLKTARLFSASFMLASVLSGFDEKLSHKVELIGEKLGLGFQIQDDYLGIWGQELKTGKSISSDLLTRKKSFPVLYGLSKSNKFNNLWGQTNLNQESLLIAMKEELEACGAKNVTVEKALGYFIESQTLLNGILPTENKFSHSLQELLTAMFSPTLVASSD